MVCRMSRQSSRSARLKAWRSVCRTRRDPVGLSPGRIMLDESCHDGAAGRSGLSCLITERRGPYRIFQNFIEHLFSTRRWGEGAARPGLRSTTSSTYQDRCRQFNKLPTMRRPSSSHQSARRRQFGDRDRRPKCARSAPNPCVRASAPAAGRRRSPDLGAKRGA